MGDPEAGKDAALIAPAHVVAHGSRDPIRSEDTPPVAWRRVVAEHGVTDQMVSGPLQAAARVATGMTGSPMTDFAGPWSHA
jgi:hypothetical protein